MSIPSDQPGTPSLTELLSRFMQRHAAACEAGLLSLEPTGEVVPFEAVPVQVADPRQAWEGAVAVFRFFSENNSGPSRKAPPDWPALVAGQESSLALALAAGNFPQLIRNLHPLWEAGPLTNLRPASQPRLAPPLEGGEKFAPPSEGGARGGPLFLPGVVEWATQTAKKQQFPHSLLAVGCLRLARQFDVAIQALEMLKENVPASWQAAWQNEQAALLWHQGQGEEALALWESQPASTPVLFNRGMACLFLDRPGQGRSSLRQAVAQIPEEEPWHHLGQMYLALAEAGQ